MKKEFLNNEIWILTFGGAFQRANIYKENYSEKIRTEFRKALRKEVEKIVAKKYHQKVEQEQHIESIYELVKYSQNLRIEGNCIPINFGVGQKLINLYLKYLWCLKEVQEPPHFPIDRIIQEKIIKILKANNLDAFQLLPWTQFEDETHYELVIEKAKLITKNVEDYKGLSLAELELKIFDRSNL
ncbi:hypothetical protein [uncultured Polaribacter sp.]|uniref:hypothetical protein n=1 Tax=uncultured Polaribacter sp. TaxID=174711 RepID=UPI00260BD1B8|nr:hypothetical protein [uncultured Polaribacter sp.]